MSPLIILFHVVADITPRPEILYTYHMGVKWCGPVTKRKGYKNYLLITNPNSMEQCLQFISYQTSIATTPWFYNPTVHDSPYHMNF